jgi:cytoskeletal protein CcmA (bactofilin family)
VVIDGTVEGDVYATGKLELAAKAKVLGNVHYNLVEMQLGSVVNGQMVSLAETVTAIKMGDVSGDEVSDIR